MSRMIYFLVVLGIIGFLAFIVNQAFTDPAEFAANRAVYLGWAAVVIVASLLIGCVSTGRWMMLGVTCLALASWYIFRVDGGRLFRVPA